MTNSTAKELLLRKLLSFAPADCDSDKMNAKIQELGLETLSDLKYIDDFQLQFANVLKAVGIAKLKEWYVVFCF